MGHRLRRSCLYPCVHVPTVFWIRSRQTTCWWRRLSVPAMMKTSTLVTPVQVRLPPPAQPLTSHRLFGGSVFSSCVHHNPEPLACPCRSVARDNSFIISALVFASRHLLTLSTHSPISTSISSPHLPSPYPLFNLISLAVSFLFFIFLLFPSL